MILGSASLPDHIVNLLATVLMVRKTSPLKLLVPKGRRAKTLTESLKNYSLTIKIRPLLILDSRRCDANLKLEISDKLFEMTSPLFVRGDTATKAPLPDVDRRRFSARVANAEIPSETDYVNASVKAVRPSTVLDQSWEKVSLPSFSWVPIDTRPRQWNDHFSFHHTLRM